MVFLDETELSADYQADKQRKELYLFLGRTALYFLIFLGLLYFFSYLGQGQGSFIYNEF